MNTLCMHDVEKVTLKRKSAPEGDGTHYWTTLVITHRASGYEQGVDDPEYRDVTVQTEITMHHHGFLKVPFKIEKAS